MALYAFVPCGFQPTLGAGILSMAKWRKNFNVEKKSKIIKKKGKALCCDVRLIFLDGIMLFAHSHRDLPEDQWHSLEAHLWSANHTSYAGSSNDYR